MSRVKIFGLFGALFYASLGVATISSLVFASFVVGFWQLVIWIGYCCLACMFIFGPALRRRFRFLCTAGVLLAIPGGAIPQATICLRQVVLCEAGENSTVKMIPILMLFGWLLFLLLIANISAELGSASKDKR